MRLIDADALMDIVENQGNVTVDDIVSAETIDPVKHGRLVGGYPGEYNDFKDCSICGEENLANSKYCCQCGSRMDGEL